MKKLDLMKIKESKTTEELLHFGIINIDKPSGPTSFSISDFIRKTLDINKTSHLGTLDPMVSGVLPILLGRACRLNEYLMHRNKTYIGIMRLHKEIERKELERTINNFIGKIMQLPPKRSRVKRAIREREVKSFDILEIDDKDVLFKTEVQAGTYIRKLCDDMGKEIGGAHMLELRRVRASLFSEDKLFTLYEFESAVEEYKKGKERKIREMLIPAEVVAEVLSIVHIQKQVVKKVLTGSPIFPNFIADSKEIQNISEGEKLCVFSEDKFIGCYKFVGTEKIVAVPEFVFN